MATPLTASTVVVPDSVPPATLSSIASVTASVASVTVSPHGYLIATSTVGAIGRYAGASVGCTVNSSLVTRITVASKVALAALVSVPDVATSV